MKHQRRIMLLLVLLILGCLFLVHRNLSQNHSQRTKHAVHSQRTKHAVHTQRPKYTGHAEVNTKNKTILVWNWPFENKKNLNGDFCKDKVGIPNCIVVDNRLQFSEADVVIFHNWELSNYRTVTLPLSQKRKEKQRWVWLSHESPLYNGNVKPLNGYFNWTMSYRRDADIFIPYGHMVPREPESKEPVEDFIPKNKTHLVCWLVSNHQPQFERTAVYHELKTVIPIMLYGKAAGKRLEASEKISTISKCYFYLAFENSIYKDYITEKFWQNSLLSGAVPVVLGPSRGDYEAVAPKDSFIHVRDFNTVKELGKFLKKLAEDKKRYASYFNWRRKYNVVMEDWLDQFCQFCPKISSMPPYKVYKDLDAWQKV